MAKASTYLQLAPEMGGLRFGPFQGVIQVGSDPRRNQLVLQPAHGIFPAHATVVETGPGTYSVAPVERACQVFLAPMGQAQVWPVQGPVQARAGDSVIFGTPAGPRFQLQSTAPVASAPSVGYGAYGAPGSASAGSTYGQRVANEMARVGNAKLMTKSPFREIYAVTTRLRTGALTNPRVIVSALTAVVTLLLGGGATCSGVALAVWNAVTR